MAKEKTTFEAMNMNVANAGKEHMEMMIEQGRVAMKGFEEMASIYMGFAQKAAEKNTATLKDMMAVKSLQDVVKLQNDWAQQNMDEMMSNATKLTEASVKLALDSYTPMSQQMEKTAKAAMETKAA